MSIGFTEMLLIAALGALLFGGRRIARLGTELGRSAGAMKRNLEKRAEGPAEGEAPKPVLVEIVEVARGVKEATDKVRKFPFS